MSNVVGYSLGCVTPVRYNLTQGEDATGNGVGFSLPSCAPPPIGDEIVTLSAVSQSSTPALIGFSEFADPSVPPKKYRTKTATPNPGYRAVYDFSCAGPLFGSDRTYYSGYEHYDALTGALTTTARLAVQQAFGAEPPVTVIYDQPVVLPTTPRVSDADGAATSGKTFTQYVADTDCHYDPSVGKWYTFKNGYAHRYDLADEDTEEDAIVRATPTVGTGAVASRTVRTTGFDFNLTTVEATLHCSNLDASLRYRVSYDIKETNLSTAQVTLTHYEVDVPAFSASYDLDAVTLSPASGFSLGVVNYNIFTR